MGEKRMVETDFEIFVTSACASEGALEGVDRLEGHHAQTVG